MQERLGFAQKKHSVGRASCAFLAWAALKPFAFRALLSSATGARRASSASPASPQRRVHDSAASGLLAPTEEGA